MRVGYKGRVLDSWMTCHSAPEGHGPCVRRGILAVVQVVLALGTTTTTSLLSGPQRTRSVEHTAESDRSAMQSTEAPASAARAAPRRAAQAETQRTRRKSRSARVPRTHTRLGAPASLPPCPLCIPRTYERSASAFWPHGPLTHCDRAREPPEYLIAIISRSLARPARRRGW